MSNTLKHKDITQKIIGAAFEVHKYLGNGFQEVVYQRALAIEMRKAGLEFAREIDQDIFYKDFPKPIGTRRADFVVAGPHRQVGMTTVAEVRKAGGDVIRTTGRSPYHATLTGLAPQQVSKLLTPTVANPGRETK